MSTHPGLSPSLWKFSEERMLMLNGHRLKASTADADGYYDVALAALGVPTRAGIFYNVEPIMHCLQDRSSRFNLMLREGYLYGHRDHPIIRSKDQLDLLTDIRHEFASHHFKSVYSGPIIPAQEWNGPADAYIIAGKIKPIGSYKNDLIENLEDPNINTTFSLRSLCREWQDRNSGVTYRDVRILVTFDWVTAPGFEHAATRYLPGNESFSMEISPEEFIAHCQKKGTGLESYTDTELRKVFNMTDIYSGDQTYRQASSKHILIDGFGDRQSLVHKLMQLKKHC